MPSEGWKHTTDHEQAANIAERLLKSWPPQDIGDPEVVTTNLIELLASYSPATVERAPNAIRGLPALFKFFPRLAEIKETLDRWEDEDRRHRETVERWNRAALPAPDGPPAAPVVDRATAPALCAKFGIRGIPPGWDAIDVTRAAAKYGDRLPEVVETLLAGGTLPVDHAPSAFAQVAQKAREAMERRQAAEAPAIVDDAPPEPPPFDDTIPEEAA